MPSKAPVPRLEGCSRTDLPRGSPPATDCAAEGGLGARYARGGFGLHATQARSRETRAAYPRQGGRSRFLSAAIA